MRSGKRATNVVSSERLAKDVTGGSDACAFFQFPSEASQTRKGQVGIQRSARPNRFISLAHERRLWAAILAPLNNRHRHIIKTARQAGDDPNPPLAIFWSTGRCTS